jgi:hypothetical protein
LRIDSAYFPHITATFTDYVHDLFYIQLYNISPIQSVAYTLSLLHFFTTVFSKAYTFRLYLIVLDTYGFLVSSIGNRQSKELTLRGRCCCSLPTLRRPLEFRPLPSRCSSLTISKLNTINSEARARSYILKPLPVNQTFYHSN